jgi:hypothetical protein
LKGWKKLADDGVPNAHLKIDLIKIAKKCKQFASETGEKYRVRI